MDRWEDAWERQQNLEQFMQPVEPFIEEVAAVEEVATMGQRIPRTEVPRRDAEPAIARKQLARQELVGMLSSRHTLRQAIVLNEIIGLPKALRKPGTG